MVEKQQRKMTILKFSSVKFRSEPEAWKAEKESINCTIRFVDPYDHRFHALRDGIPKAITIVNTETGEDFTRKMRAYQEFDITITTHAGFTRPVPGSENVMEVRMAKIVWWDEPGLDENKMREEYLKHED